MRLAPSVMTLTSIFGTRARLISRPMLLLWMCLRTRIPPFAPFICAMNRSVYQTIDSTGETAYCHFLPARYVNNPTHFPQRLMVFSALDYSLTQDAISSGLGLGIRHTFRSLGDMTAALPRSGVSGRQPLTALQSFTSASSKVVFAMP